jgi:queuine tRNA-ribosyltransferase
MLFSTLMTIHNLHFMQRFMAGIQDAIRSGRFAAYRTDFLARFYEEG